MTPTRTRVRPAWLASLALLVTLIALPLIGSTPNAQAAAPQGNPLDGNAMWVWYAPKPSRLPAMIAQLKKAHMNSVFIKSGDGSTPWPQFNRSLVDQLQSAGIHVCAWHYVYGTHPVREARVSALAYRSGAECMIIDAETEYEGKPTAARVYTRTLRKLTSNRWLIGLSTFPYLKYHTRFPYRTFLRPGAATVNLPQMYWRDIGVSPARVVRDTYRANRALGRPVYPIGQTWNAPSNGELRAFQRAVRQTGARGVSWWDWSQTSRKGWNELNGANLFPARKTKAKNSSSSIHRAVAKLVQRALIKPAAPMAALVGGV